MKSLDQKNNGEKRFRLLHSEGSSYCLTIASKDGAWQNSHYHKNALEVYVVDQGWVVYASLQGGNLDMKIVKEGEHILVNGVRVWGTPMENAVEQAVNCGKYGQVEQVLLMADHHYGYSQPVGGVVVYNNQISPSGVGYDMPNDI